MLSIEIFKEFAHEIGLLQLSRYTINDMIKLKKKLRVQKTHVDAARTIQLWWIYNRPKQRNQRKTAANIKDKMATCIKKQWIGHKKIKSIKNLLIQKK